MNSSTSPLVLHQGQTAPDVKLEIEMGEIKGG